jgi:CheY-like chemotaxis protein
MDIRMPELSGPAATQKIRQMPGDKGKIPIIAVTADVIADNRQSYLDAGMNGCVAKPINRADLAMAINEAFGETVNMAEAQEDKPVEKSNFDFDEICERLGLPEDLIIELLNKFASDYAEFPTRIQELADSDDLDGVSEVAHNLKGVSGSLGLLEISETASKIEKTAKAKNAVSVREQLPILISATRDAVTAIGVQSRS